MALFGAAALAMWWDVSPDVLSDFEDWHAHEHFPERLAVPGIRRGTRWSSATGGERMFVLYEMDDHAVLSSPAYVDRLNAPTPWSTRLMPHLRDMVRSQCRVVASRGGLVARHVLTSTLEPAAGHDGPLRDALRTLVDQLAARPGLTGAHLLVHEAPDMPPTTEQAIRDGADRVAPWIVVVSGYSRPTLEAVAGDELSDARLHRHGAAPDAVTAMYTFSYSANGVDAL